MFKGYVGEFFGFLFFFDGRANRLHPSVFLDFFFVPLRVKNPRTSKSMDSRKRDHIIFGEKNNSLWIFSRQGPVGKIAIFPLFKVPST